MAGPAKGKSGGDGVFSVGPVGRLRLFFDPFRRSHPQGARESRSAMRAPGRGSRERQGKPQHLGSKELEQGHPAGDDGTGGRQRHEREHDHVLDEDRTAAVGDHVDLFGHATASGARNPK